MVRIWDNAHRGLDSEGEKGQLGDVIYWDNNATTAMAPEVLEAMMPYLTHQYFNPSAAYKPARVIRDRVEEARHEVALLIGAKDSEITFTSGGTEATNTAFRTMAHLSGSGIAVLATDHPASIESARAWGGSSQIVNVDRQGCALSQDWERLCQQEIQGASFAYANNETGVVQDAASLIATARNYGRAVHLDAVQALGKLPFSITDFDVDFASFSSHKLHGPKGVGCLYIRSGNRCEPLIYGGGQEWAKRSGTENIAGIIGFGMAAKLWRMQGDLWREQMQDLHQTWESGLRAISGTIIQSDQALRLPNTTHVRFEGCSAESLILLLEPMGILCSAGSACASLNPTPSHVLHAMGLSDREAREGLRFSLSAQTTQQQIEDSLTYVRQAVEKVRSVQSSKTGPVLVYKP